MKHWTSLAPLLLVMPFAGCAARPAYFGNDAHVLLDRGGKYWEASAKTASCLQVRMRRRPGSSLQATAYDGTLSLSSDAPAVMRSTFTLTEGASASFHYDFNARVARELERSGEATSYFPAALDVVVECAQGACWAASKPVEISPEGRIALKSRKIRTEAREARRMGSAAKAAAARALKKDGECAILHDSLKSLAERDASIRSFTAKFGEAETRAMAKRVQGNYARKGCAQWLDEHGGVGAAWRRVRVAQWTSFRGN